MIEKLIEPVSQILDKFVVDKDLKIKLDHELKKEIFSTGSFFYSPPKEKHAFLALRKTEILVFTQGPRGGKEYESDTYRIDSLV